MDEEMNTEKEDSIDEIPEIEITYPTPEDWKRINDINLKRYAESLQNLAKK